MDEPWDCEKSKSIKHNGKRLDGDSLERTSDFFAASDGGTRADLTGADLSHADLSGINLSGAILRNANLEGTDLRKAKLPGADLSGAKLRKADLRNADMTEAILPGADLSEAQASGIEFFRCDLSNVNFQGAQLRNVNLRYANVQRRDIQRRGPRRSDPARNGFDAARTSPASTCPPRCCQRDLPAANQAERASDAFTRDSLQVMSNGAARSRGNRRPLRGSLSRKSKFPP